MRKSWKSCSVLYLNQFVPGHLPCIPCKPFCQIMQGCDMYMSLFETLSLFLLLPYSRVVSCWVVMPTRTGQEQAGCLQPLLQVPGRGRQLFGEIERKARVTHSSRSCAYFVLRAACKCRPRKDLLGMPGRVTRIISVACLSPSHAFATMTRGGSNMGRHESTFTFAIAVVTFGQLQNSTRCSTASCRTG